jgi:hypothetical protein
VVSKTWFHHKLIGVFEWVNVRRRYVEEYKAANANRISIINAGGNMYPPGSDVVVGLCTFESR